MLAYLHIPFCDSKCSYCAFNSYTSLHSLRQAYMKAVCTQLEADLKRFKIAKGSIETLFIGGGTPSTVPFHLYEPFFDLLRPYVKEGAEITTEANPNSASKAWLAGMKNLGVNRVSFGTQSFDTKKLALLNRAHTPQDTITAVNHAYEVGIKNISIDLIYATSLDTKELLTHDLDQAFALPINHLSAYALTLEEGTPLEKTPQVAQEDESLTSWLIKEIQKRGLPQYEISNFGTYQSTHNRGYWAYKPYLGIGSGAVGCVDNVRYYPLTDVAEYIKDPLQKREEPLFAEEVLYEKLFLGMRSIEGFERALLDEKATRKAELLIAEKKLIEEDGKIYNPDFLLADELVLFILE